MTPVAAAFPRLSDLADVRFANRFVAELPAGPCYTIVQPTPVAAPKLLAWSSDLAAELALASPSSRSLQMLAGNLITPGMQPYSARYGGHQFGHWAGQLGDGRAITLGEIAGQEIQLKGAGLTPYSRTADGRAVLRSSLREFLCSEAMNWLGVPTTRALSLVATGEPVIRDMFYDGHPAPEPGAIVCRVAPSFVRFGNFQILEDEHRKQLADFVIRHQYPGLSHADFFQEVCRRTALLMVDWMRLGFVHGVMNTDNLSILGLTIDYGPYGWLEGYDPQWTPNTTDLPGRRYCYGNQPQIALWNLTRLAESLLGFVAKDSLESGLELYTTIYQDAMSNALAEKLGVESLDEELMNGLFGLLGASETDFTLFFRNLAKVEKPSDVEALRPAFYAQPDLPSWEGWLKAYLARAKPGRAERMNAVNPKYIFRNYLAVLAIEALEKGDAAPLERLMRVLARPYDEQPGEEDLATRRPDWARERAGCSALSCSS
ncbi:MAG TPA: YdiU family protein [Burkholderiales bacterium]|nr:YdiU family protein [Burkholderiales bacterium]